MIGPKVYIEIDSYEQSPVPIFGALLSLPLCSYVWANKLRAWLPTDVWPPLNVGNDAVFSWLVPFTPPANNGLAIVGGLHYAYLELPAAPGSDLLISAFRLPQPYQCALTITSALTGTFLLQGPLVTSTALSMASKQADWQAAFDTAYGPGVATVTGTLTISSNVKAATLFVDFAIPSDCMTQVQKPTFDQTGATGPRIVVSDTKMFVPMQRLPGSTINWSNSTIPINFQLAPQ